MADTEQPNLTTLTVNLLSAYFANNSVESGALPELIRSTHDTLKSIEQGDPASPAEPEYTPAVSIRKSTSSKEHIISLIDGKPYKTLKRHLSGHGLTPDQYRERYGLSRDYPMVAPGYSEQRRQVAQKLGLGRKPRIVAAAASIEAPSAAAPSAGKPKPAADAKPASIAKARVKPGPKPGSTRKPAASKSKTVTEVVPSPAVAAAAPQADGKSATPKKGNAGKPAATLKAKPAPRATPPSADAVKTRKPKPAPKARGKSSPGKAAAPQGGDA